MVNSTRFLIATLFLTISINGTASGEDTTKNWGDLIFHVCFSALESDGSPREFYDAKTTNDASPEMIAAMNRNEEKSWSKREFFETWQDSSGRFTLARYDMLPTKKHPRSMSCQIDLSIAERLAQKTLEVPYQVFFDQVDEWSKEAVKSGWVRIPACPEGKRSSWLTGYSHQDRNITFFYGGGGRALIFIGDPGTNCARRKDPP